MSSMNPARIPVDVPAIAAKQERTKSPARHALTVRVTHWISAACFLALLVSGMEIVISHPRFYWGETGNDLITPLFRIPIPASRGHVPTGYSYVMPDQNGWSRALHFQSAWLIVFVGLAYILYSLFSGHLRKNLLPAKGEGSLRNLSKRAVQHLRLEPPGEEEAWSYNPLQRLSYCAVVFIVFPLIIWTGLALSPAFLSSFPATATLLGGRQSARTLHFLLSLFLVLFVIVHIFMVWRAGFWARVRAMISGRVTSSAERV